MQTFTNFPIGSRIKIGRLKTEYLRGLDGEIGVIVETETIYEDKKGRVSQGYMVRFNHPKYGWDMFVYPEEVESAYLPFVDKDFEEAFV